jgi:exopolysaccharide biosynthesis polyprenyl glycosylphosphotransferase
MALALAVLEGSSLFAAVAGMIFLWTRPLVVDWIDVLTLLGQGFAVSLCCVMAFYYNDLYDLRIVRNFGDFASRLLQSFGVAFILLAVFYALFPETKIAQGPFASSFFIIIGFLLPLRAVSYGVMRRRHLAERVLILGTSPLARALITEIGNRPDIPYTIAGVADDSIEPTAPELPYPILGPLARIGKIIQDLHPQRIIVALAERRGRLPVRQLLDAKVNGILVQDGTEVYERLTGKLAIESLTPSSLIFSQDFRISPHQLALARAVSFVASLIGLVASAPLLALIALAIKVDSRGPVFFIQNRVGRHGTHFRLIKFRTMHAGTAESSEWVRDNTDRITRVGTWLRKFRLDELPQFVNILRGDMNLVGPRPHPVSNCELFLENIPYYGLRSVIRPGVTGWAQVHYGYANSLDEETEKMRYDLYYIKHFSLWLDLRILLDTVKIVLFGRGATAAGTRLAGSSAAAGTSVAATRHFS